MKKTLRFLTIVLLSITTGFGQSAIKKIYHGAISGGGSALTDNGVLHYVAQNGTYYQTNITTKKISRIKSQIKSSNGTFSPNGNYVIGLNSVNNPQQNIIQATLYDIEQQRSYALPDSIYTSYYSKEYSCLFTNNSSLLIISSITLINSQNYWQYKYYDTQTGAIKRTVIDTINYSKYFSQYSPNNYYKVQVSVSSDFRYLLIYRVSNYTNIPSLITLYDLETKKVAVRIAPSSLNYFVPISLSVTDTNHYSATYIQNTSSGRSIINYIVFGSTAFDMTTQTTQLPYEPYTNTGYYHSKCLLDKNIFISWFTNNNYITNTLRVFNLESKQSDSVVFDFYFSHVITSPNESTLGFITDNGIYTYSIDSHSKPTHTFPDVYWGSDLTNNYTGLLLYTTTNKNESLFWAGNNSTFRITGDGIIRLPFYIQSISPDATKYTTLTHVNSFDGSSSTQFCNSYTSVWSSFSSDNNKLIYSNRYYLRRFDIASESIDALYRTTTDGLIYNVDISDDKTWVAGCLPDYSTVIWNTNEPNNPKYVYGHYSSVTLVKFSHNNSMLATCSADSTLRFWDVGTLSQLHKVKTSGINAMVFSSNNNYLITNHTDTTLRVWDIRNGKLIRTFKEHDYPLISINISADGQTIATGAADGSVILWDAHALGLFNIVGVDDNNQTDEITISAYPNPCSSDILQFSLPNNSQLHNIRVINSLGSVVMEEVQPQQPLLNIQHLPSGNYYAILRQSTSTVRVPFVVVH